MNENQMTKEKISTAEAVRLKKKLELDIFELLDKFRQETTLTPTAVRLRIVTYASLELCDDKRLTQVDIDVCL